MEIFVRIITSSRWWHNFPFSPFSRVSRGKTQACIFSYEIWTSLVSGLLRYYIKIGAFVIWRDERTEGMRDFYLQKDGRRNWMVRQKMGQMGRSVVQIHCSISQDGFFRCKFLSCLKLSLRSDRVQCCRVQAVPQKTTPQHASHELVNTNKQRGNVREWKRTETKKMEDYCWAIT